MQDRKIECHKEESISTFKKKYYGKVVLLKDYNVVHDEIITYSKSKSKLIGLVWKYIPDSAFHNRRYMIIDVD